MQEKVIIGFPGDAPNTNEPCNCTDKEFKVLYPNLLQHQSKKNMKIELFTRNDQVAVQFRDADGKAWIPTGQASAVFQSHYARALAQAEEQLSRAATNLYQASPALWKEYDPADANSLNGIEVNISEGHGTDTEVTDQRTDMPDGGPNVSVDNENPTPKSDEVSDANSGS